MADYQKKEFPFLHTGMDWNRPPEKIPHGKLPWAKNVRVLQQGTITSANGHTEYVSLPGTYAHTISRLNINSNEYDGNLTPTYVVGVDQQIRGRRRSFPRS